MAYLELFLMVWELKGRIAEPLFHIPDVIKKEAEVGHLTGSKFDSDGSELYSIIKFKDIEPAKALAISEFQKQVKNSNLGRYFTQ